MENNYAWYKHPFLACPGSLYIKNIISIIIVERTFTMVKK